MFLGLAFIHLNGEITFPHELGIAGIDILVADECGGVVVGTDCLIGKIVSTSEADMSSLCSFLAHLHLKSTISSQSACMMDIAMGKS